ncbi:MAG TPA: ATP-binding protein, partial [Gemmatimonadaceae bacterium]|nr:ATP-binding protein [Gemmatimonadaceae bacterium]
MPGTAPGLRRSSIVLGAVILFLFAGLYATDRVLTQSSREELRVDAAEAATHVESFLSLRADAIVALRALYMGSAEGGRRRVLADYVAALPEFLPGVQRVWIADSSGVIVEDFAVAAGPGMERFDMDTARALGFDELMRRARRGTRPAISRPGALPGVSRGVAMVVPICRGDGTRCRGFVAALVSTDSLLATTRRRVGPEPMSVTLLAGADTVAVHAGPLGGAIDTARVEVPTPDGGRWTVVVGHESAHRRARLLLWSVGLAAVATLIWGLVRERRDAVQASERSRELERLSNEALKANRAKSEFLANVSHELRTPLNAIVGFVDLLRDGVYGVLSPRQIPPVDRIAASATHLRHLVDQVLDIAKIAAGRLEVHRESIDLRPFVLDVATEVEPLMSEKQLNISISVPASLPRVRTDPTLLRQILVNLIGNAVKYTPTGGIAVKARLVGGAPQVVAERTEERLALSTAGELRALAPDPNRPWVALQVVDTGIGIAPADHARVFEEFEQVNAGPRGDSMHRGTGLGLSISRRLARLLGGEITLQSEVGKGSTFTLWVPAHPEDILAR